MDWITWNVVLIVAAAWFGGALNAVAGGGTFITFPALVAIGIPPIQANATSALSVCPGYFGGVLGFWQDIKHVPKKRMLIEAGISAIGGASGALLLLMTSSEIFDWVVPWLLLIATVIFMMAPWMRKELGNIEKMECPRQLGLMCGTAYGGYFNGGVGIILLALYMITGEKQINTANGMKNLNTAILSVTSVVTYIIGGAIIWGPAILMSVMATTGGVMGARISRKLPEKSTRIVVICIGLGMTMIFFMR